MALRVKSRGRGAHWLTSTVFGIGMASLFSDLCHEAVTAVLPALLASMGVAAGVLGTIEGVADGLSSAAKLYGGWWLQFNLAINALDLRDLTLLTLRCPIPSSLKNIDV